MDEEGKKQMLPRNDATRLIFDLATRGDDKCVVCRMILPESSNMCCNCKIPHMRLLDDARRKAHKSKEIDWKDDI